MEVSSNQHIPNDTFPPPPAPACTIKVSYVDAANNTHTYQLDVGQTDDTLGKLASAILAKAKLSEQGEATISVTRDVGAEGTAQIRVIQGDSISTLPDTIKITDKALEALKNAQSAKGSTKPALPPYPRV